MSKTYKKYKQLYKLVIKKNGIRNNERQKEKFAKDLEKYAIKNKMIFDILSFSNEEHTNIVLGNFNDAKYIFCAHYDTPKYSLKSKSELKMNNYTLSKIYGLTYPIKLIIIFLVISGILLIPFFSYVLFAIFLLNILGLFIYLLMIIPIRENPFNANDNSSGVILALMLAKGKDDCIILFDNEEVPFKQGSQFVFVNLIIGTKFEKLFINFDSIGYGDLLAYDFNNLSNELVNKLSSINAEHKEGLHTDLLNMTNVKSIGFSRYDLINDIEYAKNIHSPADKTILYHNILQLYEIVNKLISF